MVDGAEPTAAEGRGGAVLIQGCGVAGRAATAL
jgi:hypothetical protein